MARTAQEDAAPLRSEEHTSELQSQSNLVCRLLLESIGVHRGLHSFPTRRSSDLWAPILDRVREVELGHPASWSEANGRLVYIAESPGEAAQHLHSNLK